MLIFNTLNLFKSKMSLCLLFGLGHRNIFDTTWPGSSSQYSTTSFSIKEFTTSDSVFCCVFDKLNGFGSFVWKGISLKGICNPWTVCLTQESFVIFVHSDKQCLILPALNFLTGTDFPFSSSFFDCKRCTLVAEGPGLSTVGFVETPHFVYFGADFGLAQ